MTVTEDQLDDAAEALAARLNRLFACPDGHLMDPVLRSGSLQCPACRPVAIASAKRRAREHRRSDSA